MLAPKRTKYRKAHKGRIHGNAKGGTDLNFGSFGLKAQSPGRVTARQIEASKEGDYSAHETCRPRVDPDFSGCPCVSKACGGSTG